MNIKDRHKKLVSRLVSDVMEACVQFNGSITSFGRTIKHNASTDVDGMKTSWHLDFLAIDIILDNSEKNEQEFSFSLIKKGYRIVKSKECYHIQYNWPYIDRFIRKDIYSHLAAIIKNFTICWSNYE